VISVSPTANWWSPHATPAPRKLSPGRCTSVGEAGSFTAEGEFCTALDPTDDAATPVASEPLFQGDRVWREIPQNHLVTVTPDGTTTTEPPDVDVSLGAI
jgi:predicted glutamine amidotransferase